MKELTQVDQKLNKLRFSSLAELAAEIDSNFRVATAVFADNGLLVTLSMSEKRCKCYFMMLHNHPNECSIFNEAFAQSVLEQQEDTDMLCNYSCRLSLRNREINGNKYKFLIFQYLFDTDSKEFNPNNNPDFRHISAKDMILHISANAVWTPTILTKYELDSIMSFFIVNSEKFLD